LKEGRPQKKKKKLNPQTIIIFKVKKLMVAHSITVSSEQLFDITDLGKSMRL